MKTNTSDKILVVDDNEELREFISLSLRNAGYEVVEVADGADALQELERTNYRLMIMDVMMPRINGLEVLQQIEQQGGYCPHILMVSKLPHIEATIKRFNLPRISFLAKPFEPVILLERVHDIYNEAG